MLRALFCFLRVDFDANAIVAEGESLPLGWRLIPARFVPLGVPVGLTG